MTMVSSFGYHSFLIHIVLLFCVFMPLGTMCFTMKLIPREDIDPIFFPKNISEEEKYNRMLKLSEMHAHNYLVSNTNKITPQTFQPSVKNYDNFYVVEMRIGTPRPHTTYLLLDTGSDDTWLQCDGCSECFPIKDRKNFKYHKSQTFKEVSCDDPLCVPKKCSPTGKCIYDTEYAGGAISKGIVLSENFTFPDPTNKNHPFVSFKGVVFGCGLQNRGITFGKQMDDTNIIGGVFGMDTSPRSLLTQLSGETKMRFSYCLDLPQTSKSRHTSYLHFGNDAKISGDFKTIQLLTKQGNTKLTRYYVVCTGISFSGKILPINPELFKLKPGREGGFVFDSGSPATYLVEGVFNMLKRSVIDYFQTKYKLHPFTKRKLAYDLCYLDVPKKVVKPGMAYYFQGGSKFEVDPNSLFMTFKAREGNMFCMNVVAMPNEKVPNVLGAHHQSNHVLLFDVEKNVVSFNPMPHACI